MIKCWPIVRKTATPRVHVYHHPHNHPIHPHSPRGMHHLGAALTSKGAIIAYTCVAIGGGSWFVGHRINQGISAQPFVAQRELEYRPMETVQAVPEPGSFLLLLIPIIITLLWRTYHARDKRQPT